MAVTSEVLLPVNEEIEIVFPSPTGSSQKRNTVGCVWCKKKEQWAVHSRKKCPVSQHIHPSGHDTSIGTLYWRWVIGSPWQPGGEGNDHLQLNVSTLFLEPHALGCLVVEQQPTRLYSRFYSSSHDTCLLVPTGPLTTCCLWKGCQIIQLTAIIWL